MSCNTKQDQQQMGNQAQQRLKKSKFQSSKYGPGLSSLDGFVHLPALSVATFESAAFTSTSAIFSIGLTLLTLFTLYQGLQNISLNSSKQMSLRNQTFFCVLVPIVIIYYTKLTLEDYINAKIKSSKNKPTGKSGNQAKVSVGLNHQSSTGPSGSGHYGSNNQNQIQKQVLFKNLNLQNIVVDSDDENNQISSYMIYQNNKMLSNLNSHSIPMFLIDRQFQSYANKAQLMNDKKLLSPTYTDSTDEPTPMGFFNQGKGFQFNMNMEDDAENIGFEDSNVQQSKTQIENGKKDILPNQNQSAANKKSIFGKKRSLFKSWFNLKKSSLSGVRKADQSSEKSSDALPFNSLELFLFVQNIFLCVFSEKENAQLDLLFSVAIMILVYFIVLQTFFQGRKNLRNKLDSFDDHFQLDEENQDMTEDSRTSSMREDDQILREVFKGDINKLEKPNEKVNNPKDTSNVKVSILIFYYIQIENDKKMNNANSISNNNLQSNVQPTSTNNLQTKQTQSQVDIATNSKENLKRQQYQQQLLAQEHDQACKIIRELIRSKSKKVRMENKKIFIVVQLQYLKRVGEGALRWSFFTLNLFMLTLYICQN
ncbi:UNKNOWN [Stylonychia lemnae]|uniref:Transmembrane protein n=1 Tax=Stylonychia lemnae TaxID=5949 RepID=A0A078A522_STYLE|nr:UNKNOWN [Stylonychia lemnae]|eukprot:CDW77365.1 UNKNOWN [Stylonychia lemnae]